MKGQFVNVDLTLRGTEVDRLAAAFAPETVVISGDGDRVTLELTEEPISIEHVLRRFVAMVDAFPESVRRAWDSCSVRAFDIGILCWDEQFRCTVPSDVLHLVARIGADLGFAVYPQGDAE
jgi:hypothetical protein